VEFEVNIMTDDIRNTKSGEVKFSGCQTTDYQEQFSTKDLGESGIHENHE
jgi:hypothetical protein